jgi:hypothetical protein
MLGTIHQFEEGQQVVDVVGLADVLRQVEAPKPRDRLERRCSWPEGPRAMSTRLTGAASLPCEIEAGHLGVIERHVVLCRRSSALALLAAIWFWLAGAAGFSRKMKLLVCWMFCAAAIVGRRTFGGLARRRWYRHSACVNARCRHRRSRHSRGACPRRHARRRRGRRRPATRRPRRDGRCRRLPAAAASRCSRHHRTGPTIRTGCRWSPGEIEFMKPSAPDEPPNMPARPWNQNCCSSPASVARAGFAPSC